MMSSTGKLGKFKRWLFASETSLRFRVTGTSMEPFLTDGQAVPSRTFRRLCPGRCYFFLRQETVLLHRLVTVYGSIAVFAGDNREAFEFVPSEDIIGELDVKMPRPVELVYALINNVCYRCCNHSSDVPRHVVLRIRRKCMAFINRLQLTISGNAAFEPVGTGGCAA